MFTQYQQQESSAVGSAIRTVSAASHDAETSTEETAPSTVIELTVDEGVHDQSTPDSTSTPNLSSSPPEGAGEGGPTAATASNILAEPEAEDDPPSPSDEETKAAGDASVEAQQEEPKTEAHSETPDGDDSQTASALPADVAGVDVAVSPAPTQTVENTIDSTDTDDAQIPQTDGDKSRESDERAESSASVVEASLNTPEVASPEPDAEDNQEAVVAADSLEDGTVETVGGGAGASVSNEDPSDAEDSLEPSSGEDTKAEKPQEGEDEAQVETDTMAIEEVKEKEEEKAGEEKATARESESEKNEEAVLDPQSEDVNTENADAGEQSAPVPDATPTDPQSSDSAAPSSAQEPSATSAPIPADPQSAAATTKEEVVPAEASASSTPPPSTNTQKAAEPAAPTKEIKIARLDVSNVALDTERLELKETSASVGHCLTSSLQSSSFLLTCL